MEEPNLPGLYSWRKRRPRRHFHSGGLISSFVAFRRALRKGDLGMQGTLRFVRLRPRALLGALSLLVLSLPVLPVHAATTGAVETYLVTYKDGASSGNAAATISGAGG